MMAQELDSISHMLEPNLDSMMVRLWGMDLVQESGFVTHMMESLSESSMVESLGQQSAEHSDLMMEYLLEPRKEILTD